MIIICVSTKCTYVGGIVAIAIVTELVCILLMLACIISLQSRRVKELSG